MKYFFQGLLAVLAIWAALTFVYYGSSESVVITVTGKERVVQSSGSGEDASVSSKYLVFTESETFQNTDMLFIGKFNSSDIQGRLREDSTYHVVAYGWRVPFLSMYRNIGKIEAP